MKKMIFTLSVLGVMLLAGSPQVMAQTDKKATPQQDGKWKKSTNGRWQGSKDGTNYWYKTDKSGKLTYTSDNKKWTDVPDNRWMGYDGKWYRISGNNLMSSTDGNSWVNTPDRTWRGADGTWYMFDNNWILWTGGNGTLPPSHSDMK